MMRKVIMIIFIIQIYTLFPIALLGYYFKVLSLPYMRKYTDRSVICYLLLDFFSKFLISIFVSDNIIDGDLFVVMLLLVPSIWCILIFLLNKSIGPQIDVRKIKKMVSQRSLSISNYFSIMLTILSPLYATELYLYAMGYDGVVNFYQLLPEMKEILNKDDAKTNEDFAAGLTIALVAYICFVFSCVLLLLKSRKKDQKGLTFENINTTIPPILFLRSFELNKTSVSLKTFDEYLSSNFLMSNQPVISLADPDEAFANGTIKFQAEDNYWKEAIVEIFKHCRAVIMFEGKSDGLNWEIDNIKKYIPYNRFFVAIPPEDYRISAWVTGDVNFSTSTKIQIWWAKHFSVKSIQYAYNYIWTRFYTRLLLVGIELPKELPKSGSLFSFDENWKTNKIYENLIESDFFNTVLSLIPPTDSNTYDYKVLTNSIKNFEVNGAITPEMDKKCKRFSNMLCLFMFLFFLIGLMLLLLII